MTSLQWIKTSCLKSNLCVVSTFSSFFSSAGLGASVAAGAGAGVATGGAGLDSAGLAAAGLGWKFQKSSSLLLSDIFSVMLLFQQKYYNVWHARSMSENTTEILKEMYLYVVVEDLGSKDQSRCY